MDEKLTGHLLFDVGDEALREGENPLVHDVARFHLASCAAELYLLAAFLLQTETTQQHYHYRHRSFLMELLSSHRGSTENAAAKRTLKEQVTAKNSSRKKTFAIQKYPRKRSSCFEKVFFRLVISAQPSLQRLTEAEFN